jgi:hypothetical protein
MYDHSLVSRLNVSNEHGQILVPVTPTRDQSATSKKYVDSLADEINFRIDQLASASLIYTEYSGIMDSVPVPSNSARYAIVEKIGGASHKSENLFDSSELTGKSKITVNSDRSITLNGVFEWDTVDLGMFYGDYVGYVCMSIGLQNSDIFVQTEYQGEWGGMENLYFGNGPVTWHTRNTVATLVLFGTFDNLTIYPMLVKGKEPKPYQPFFIGLSSTDVTSIRSEEPNGDVYASIDIPASIKDKLPEHFEFGDGFEFYNGVDTAYYGNYLDTLKKTVNGNVARMVFDGSENGWRVKTNSSTGITRFQINYSAASGDIGYPTALNVTTKEAVPAFCNAYASVSASANNNGAKGIAFSATTFFVHDPAFSTLDAWLEHLQSNPLTIVYKVEDSIAEDVSDTISDEFKQIAVKSLGKVKPMSKQNTAAMMTIAFVEAKGVG